MTKTLFLIIAILVLVPLLGVGCVEFKTSASADGGIFRSNDKGETWIQKGFVRKEKKKEITIHHVATGTLLFHPLDPATLYLGTFGQGIFRGFERGERWEPLGIGTGVFLTISIDPKAPTTIYAGTGSTILKSSDDGKQWDTIYLDPRGQTITSVNVDPDDPSRIYASTNEGGVLFSADAGNTWSIRTTISPGIQRIILDPKNSRILYAILAQGIMKSFDSGATWISLNADLEKWPGAKIIHTFVSSLNTILLGTNYGLLQSTNGGINWQSIPLLAPPGSVAIKAVATNPQNSQEIWIAIGRVIHRTTDGGVTWKPIENFPSSREINLLLPDPQDPMVLYAGTAAPKKKRSTLLP